MTTQRPPRLASLLLERLAPDDPVIAGDLEERYRGGRSRAWLWGQALVAIAVSPFRQIRKNPLRAVGALVLGWGILAVVFLAGDLLAYNVAGELSRGWTHAGAYRTGVWWPFQVSAVLVSYAGFGLSAWIVGRTRRGNAGPLLLLYIASVQFGLIAFATFAAILAPRPIVVPHPLFYFVSIALPYQGRSGLILAPLVMLITGLAGSGRSRNATKHRLVRA